MWLYKNNIINLPAYEIQNKQKYTKSNINNLLAFRYCL